MKILLVYPDIEGVEHYGARKYYHGLGYLSAVLKASGHDTALHYADREPEQSEFVATVAAAAPRIVGFSSTTHQHPYVERWAAWIKQAMPELLLVSGGTHPTLAPEQVAQSPHLDVICVGEGEDALRELADRVAAGESFDTVQNLWVRRGGEWVRNELRPLVHDLDRLPFPDREVFDSGALLQSSGGWVDLMAGRGCPYQCSYCSNPALQKRYRGLGNYVRFRSVANVLAEIAALAQRYPVKTLNFQDDTFTLDRHWTREFCQEYRAQFRFPFWINTRVEHLTDEVVAALAGARCRGVRIGIESGDEQVRRDILKRRMSNAEIEEAFKRLRRHGLLIYTCNMLGVPGETPDKVQRTIELNRRLEPDDLQFSVFYPYPMTELYDLSAERGYLHEGVSLSTYYSRQSILNLPGLSPESLAELYDQFVALKSELSMRRTHPWKYRARKGVRRIAGSPERFEAWMRAWRGAKRRVRGRALP